MSVERFIRRREVLHRTGLGATTLFKLQKKGEFPKSILLTPRCAVWDEAEVNAWLDARAAKPATPTLGIPRMVRVGPGEALL